MPTFFKPVAVLLTIVGAIGLLIHDMHVDRMAAVVVGTPVALATYGLVDNMLKKSDHTHVDRAGFDKMPGTAMRTSTPKVRPRDDGHRYIQNKKVLFAGGGESNSLWPSV